MPDSPHRVNLSRTAPGPFQALLALSEQAEQHATAAGLDPLLQELVKIRVSQLNGCAFCLRLHTEAARKAGETDERLAVLPAWRETEYFSAPERAALALSEAVTLIADGHVPDAVYAEAAAHLDEQQLSAVSWLAVTLNAFNRVAVTSRYHVKPKAGR